MPAQCRQTHPESPSPKIEGMAQALHFNLQKAVKSTARAYCTEFERVFFVFLLHRMGDTVSEKNKENPLKFRILDSLATI